MVFTENCEPYLVFLPTKTLDSSKSDFGVGTYSKCIRKLF